MKHALNMTRPRAWRAGYRALLCCGLVAALSAPVSATTYYVAPNGNDSGSGGTVDPWGSVQRAADAAVAGDTVIVREGIYGERVRVVASGTNGAPISFVSEPALKASVVSFAITGDHIVIDGFDVEADMTALTGIVVRAADGVVVKNSYVHGCPLMGIDVTYFATNAQILNNRIDGNGQMGIQVIGSYALIAGNEVSGTVQHHPKGEPPGLTGHDADGIRVFGDHHVVRGNYIHDIADPTDSVHNVDPHADCIQTLDEPSANGRRVMTDTIIERNYCRIDHPSGKGVILSAIHDDVCHDVTIRNNIFEFRDEGVAADEGQFRNIFVENNVFKANLGEKIWGVGAHLVNVDGYSLQNNIMVDCDRDSRKIVGGNGVVAYNLSWHSDGSTPGGSPGPQPTELWGVDPLFVGYTGAQGSDYHLDPASPAVDQGTALSRVSDDFNGVQRPQGAGYDIGAYEWTEGGAAGGAAGSGAAGAGGSSSGGSNVGGSSSGGSGVGASAGSVGSSGAAGATGGSGANSGGTSAATPGADAAQGGCGCRTGPGPDQGAGSLGLLALVMVGVARRRPRRPQRRDSPPSPS